MNREDMAWVAGVFEGEGAFILTQAGQLYGTLQMTDEDIVQRLRTIVGFGNMHGPYRYGHMKQYAWRWTVSSFEDVQAFIAMVWPWLGTRRRAKARSLLIYRSGCTCRRPGIRGRHKIGCGLKPGEKPWPKARGLKG